MTLFKEIKDSLLHLAFPHICAGCGSDNLDSNHYLCLRCISLLPETHFHLNTPNPAEKIFWGRIPVYKVTSQYYFTKASMMQRIMHQFKYKGHKELGYYMGKLMGKHLAESGLFSLTDFIIPMPLHKSKQKLRGFNQAEVLSTGVAKVLNKPVLKDIAFRNYQTESQTKKNRIERWQNIQEGFKVINGNNLQGKHILLIDDVLTTGATLEACGRAILQIPEVKLSIATLCISSGN